jgi:hypothetical protein
MFLSNSLITIKVSSLPMKRNAVAVEVEPTKEKMAAGAYFFDR